ncbi:hypothetical protein D9611_004261 [Ephemerocybe angulata]|uniref:Enoyl reductase (ER) domain-containing protein n=1 Tax=Ephemerocybe angulata TaxID=980116 RepID=A0A8H5BJY4_9AGAR|nr:hypothetical protein D9611_004261 [Tulosesus angulatus]
MATSIPETQKAWVSTKKAYPPSRSLQLRTDWPVKKILKTGEVTVKVHAAGLNPLAWKLMRYLPSWVVKRPWVPESDFSGVVVDAEKSAVLREGDEVYGWIVPGVAFSSKQGALSEYITLPAAYLVKRPANISAIEAAGITVTAMFAQLALNEAKLSANQTIFINGGSTAVGAWTIQLAKLRGAKVVVSCSKRNEEYVKGLGADEVIDYTSVGPLHTYLAQNPPPTKFHVILDAIGLFDSSLYTKSSAYLHRNGVYLTVGPMPHEFSWGVVPQLLKWTALLSLPWWLTGVRPKAKNVMAANKVEDMELLRGYLEGGMIKPTVDSVYEFADAAEAYDKLVTGRARGKIIVNVSLPPDAGKTSV